MHITDNLSKALRERDEAQARYEQALTEHREAYPWLLIEERKQPLQPTEDMADPTNWRAGDWLECKHNARDLTAGKLYKVLGKDEDGAPIIDDDAERIARPAYYFRFYARPQ